MRVRMFATGGGMALLLAACASTPPSHYYSLAGQDAPALALAASRMEHKAGSGQAYGLQLQVRSIPADVDRIQIVVRDPARAPAVDVLNQSIWSAPLDQQIQRLLAAGVAARLGVVDMQRLPAATSMPVRTIDVRITQFDLIWGQGAYLGAVWTDQGMTGKPARVCQAAVQSKAPIGVANLVDAQKRSLAALVSLMADPADALAAGLPNDTQVNHIGCT
ncbi:PqiC family protein [Castellaniella sp.]|uniref:PqiC family protein n=1 Tax=Castellaniella sp. TaxID=1955812 RepID=UPI003C77444F